mmetsp:Transcript_44319/g.106768  ORF Transcript_44319/g.106768 Transcript_44319/m.106768 type:complete len:205 (-) Transcript_44319:517-1131(-)
MNVRLEDFSLGFLLQKVVKVINDSSLVGPWNITDSRKEASIGGVACCNGLGVKSRKGRVPELEESSDFFFVDFLGDVQVLGHDRRMMMGNLPLLVFVYVGVSVTSLDLVTSSSHGKFVDSVVHAPVITGSDIGFQDFSLGLLLEKVNKVVLDRVVICSWNITDSWEQAWVLGVSFGHSVGAASGQGVVPQVEETADFRVGNALG